MLSAAVFPTLPVADSPGQGPLFRAARAVLIFMLALTFAGVIPFLNVYSSLLLYGTYALIGACMAVCLVCDWGVSRQMRSVAPYLLWTFGYFLWGMLAGTDSEAVKEGAKQFFKHLLIIGSFALAIEVRTLGTFAQLVQVAVLGNVALCLYEVANPDLVELIARTREPDATAFNVLRPAGLWSNPDESAFAFVFAVLISHWARGPLAWMGRLAALTGLFLGASRTGFALLLLCGALQVWQWIQYTRVSAARLAGICAALLFIGGSVAFVVTREGVDFSEHWQLQRMLDFTEETRDAEDASRLEIAQTAVLTALQGPWYGHGLFAFQGGPTLRSVLAIPAHNIYLVVWGEAGPVAAITYFLVLGLGLWRLFQASIEPRERLSIARMWICYLIIGVTWHNQFTSFSGMLYVAWLWHLPSAVACEPEHQPTVISA